MQPAGVEESSVSVTSFPVMDDDKLMAGGYPDKSAVLVVGPPGIGKKALGYWLTQTGLVQ